MRLTVGQSRTTPTRQHHDATSDGLAAECGRRYEMHRALLYSSSATTTTAPRLEPRGLKAGALQLGAGAVVGRSERGACDRTEERRRRRGVQRDEEPGTRTTARTTAMWGLNCEIRSRAKPRFSAFAPRWEWFCRRRAIKTLLFKKTSTNKASRPINFPICMMVN